MALRGQLDSQVDLLVVGGGPAGLVTAMEACRRGLRTRVLDRRYPPIDKPCGEGLMPDGLERLHSLGVRVEGRPFAGIHYLDSTGPRPLEVVGNFPSRQRREVFGPGSNESKGSRNPGEGPGPGRSPARGPVVGLGIRRTTLHAALVDRAEALGVELEWGVQATGLQESGLGASGPKGSMLRRFEGVETTAGLRRGRYIVGADGLRSRVRSWAGLGSTARPQAKKKRRFGVRRHLQIAPWSRYVEVYWSEGAEAYVTPISSEEVGVAILWSGFRGGFDQILSRFPELETRLEGAPRLSRDRGTGPLLQRPRRVVRGNLALVGDAGGYLDAITGEGLSVAFHQAASVAEAIATEQLSYYPRQHRRILRLPETLTSLLLFLERRPTLRRRVLGALQKEPRIFERFLAVHCREASAWTLGPGAPRMLWRLAQG